MSELKKAAIEHAQNRIMLDLDNPKILDARVESYHTGALWLLEQLEKMHAPEWGLDYEELLIHARSLCGKGEG